MKARCDEIQVIYKLNKEGKGRPYERYLKTKFSNQQERCCLILGEGFYSELKFVHNLQEFSFTKRRQLKKKDKRDEDPITFQIRDEWLRFVKIWIEESNLFHKDYPRSQNTSFYELRHTKLGIQIYKYLHENSIYHQILDKENKSTPSIDWMKGHWFPSMQSVDPVLVGDDDDDQFFDDYIFSLQGNLYFISLRISFMLIII